MALFDAPLGASSVVGQTQRRRNGRPDTPEEMYADQIARGQIPPGSAGPVGSGTTIFNQPQRFPGSNFGSNDVARSGTYLSDWYFNQIGPMLERSRGLFDQGQGIFGQNQDLLNRGYSLYDTGMNLYNQFGGLYDQLGGLAGRFGGLSNQFGGLYDKSGVEGLVGQVAGINKDILGGKMPQAVEQLISPYLEQGISKINAQVPTAWRQAEDNLPRALAAEAKMNTMDSAVRGAADLTTSLYNSVAPQLFQQAMAAGDPSRAANLLTARGGIMSQEGNVLGQQGGVLGQQGGVLGQQGNILGQQGGIIGQGGNILGQLGTMLGLENSMVNQQALTPWQIIRDIGTMYNQRYGIEQAGKAQGGK